MDKVNFFESITHDDEVRICALSNATIEIMIEDGINLERKTALEDAIVAIDDLIGGDFVVDSMIRHKWPDEKPDEDGQYLIRIISPSGSVYYRLRGYEDGEWHNFGNYLTHWWNLPEVTE